MYDIKPLEAQWEQYNRKRRKPFYRNLLLVIFLILAAVAAYYYKDLIVAQFEKSTSDLQKNELVFPVSLDLPLDTLMLKKGTEKEQLTIDNIAKRAVTKRDDNPMEPGDVFIEVSDPSSAESGSEIRRKKPSKKINIEVSDVSYDAYRNIEARFSDSHEVDDALFLARGYYSRKKYRKAAYWALQTNKLDGNIEESWLIFAKAKAKTGQKNEAIRVLSQYVKKSNSAEAKRLLHSLEK